MEVDNDISDGYHTFNELYKHRHGLFLIICLSQPDKCRWKLDEQADNWFILYWESPNGQISYHIPYDYLDLVQNTIKQDQLHKWDGHTSNDVLERLRLNALNARKIAKAFYGK